MDQSLTTDLHDEVLRIGDWLLARTLRHPQGWSWKTIRQEGTRISWKEQDNVYNGVGGIVLFFLALYQYTRQEKYLEAARQGTRWMVDRYERESSTSFALLTGSFSLPWVLLRLHAVTQESEFLIQAQRQVASPALDQFSSSPLVEFINGTSGTLLGLMHLHAASPHDWLLVKIAQYVEALVRQIHHGRQGVYWDRGPNNVHGLCGLSHGAGGIGWVFLEVGRYFNNPAFSRIAAQAFAYEDQFYDTRFGNWYDLRRGIFTDRDEEDYRTAYAQGDLEFFTSQKDMNAWCHGAVGIGLCRLRAHQLGEGPLFPVERALEKTIRTDVEAQRWASPTLCHGSGGNAELFIEAARVLKEPHYRTLAETVAQRALRSYWERGFYPSGTQSPEEDTSLYLGTAGIGYFYLRLLSPENTPSVLLPVLDSTPHRVADASSFLRVTPEELQQRMYAPLFRRTLHHLPHPSIKGDRPSLVSWVGGLRELITSLPNDVRWQAEDAFALDVQRREVDLAIPSDTLLHYMQLRIAEDIPRLLAQEDDLLRAQSLVIDRHLALVRTPEDQSDEETPPANQNSWLLVPALDGVKAQSVTPFLHLILDVFQEERTVQQAIRYVAEALDGLSADQQAVQPLVLQQIREAIRVGFLIDPKQHPVNAHVSPLTETFV